VTLWLDVEDLFAHAARHARLTGIQRLSLEAAAALHAALPDQVGFLRGAARGTQLRVVPWAAVEALRGRLDAPGSAPRRGADDSAATREPRWRAPAGLPEELRAPLGAAFRAQVAALQALGRAVSAAPALWRREPGAVRGAFGEVARPGDVLASLGSPWADAGHARLLTESCAVHDMRLAFLVHDCIPLRRPEFCDHRVVAQFRAFLRTDLPRADHILTTTGATAAELMQWADAQGIVLRSAPTAVPIGTTFDVAPAPTLPAGLRPGGYVLMVGTLEARKNHWLAFRVWQRLLEELPPDRMPDLVFAGRVGWMVQDLMQALDSAGWLGRRIRLLEGPDDATLAALYRGCRFTLFPSHCEGWGLPVSESLACGKACIASDRGAIREAGGDLCLYIDPDDVTGALGVVRGAIEDPARIAALEARIAATYRPRPWSDTAAAIIAALGLR
jgi:glycosyltransferase involved in cell wall biosynthesis